MKRKLRENWKESNTWDNLADTPEEFCEAIENAVSENERVFFETLLYKVLNETAASNDVLMHENDNEDRLYILRVGTDDIMIAQYFEEPDKESIECEFGGLFFALTQDLYDWTGRHETLQEWLRNRDYKGVRYDRNNDYL